MTSLGEHARRIHHPFDGVTFVIARKMHHRCGNACTGSGQEPSTRRSRLRKRVQEKFQLLPSLPERGKEAGHAAADSSGITPATSASKYSRVRLSCMSTVSARFTTARKAEFSGRSFAYQPRCLRAMRTPDC